MADEDDTEVSGSLGDQLAAIVREESPAPEAEATETVETTAADPTPTTEATAPEVPAAPVETVEDARHRFAKITGFQSVLEKYKTEEDFFAGVGELSRTIGKRNEDAEFAKWVRENPREAVQAIREHYGIQDAPAAAKPVETQPSDGKPEWNPAWQYIVKQENPDPEIVRKYNTAVEWANKRQHDLLFSPEKVLAPIVEKAKADAKAEALKEFESKWVERDQAARYAAVQQHAYSLIEHDKALLFNGDTLTPLGQSYMNHLGRISTQFPNASPDDKHDYAKRQAMADARMQAPVVPATPAAKPAAARKPNVALTPSGGESDEFPDGSNLQTELLKLYNTQGRL